MGWSCTIQSSGERERERERERKPAYDKDVKVCMNVQTATGLTIHLVSDGEWNDKEMLPKLK